MAEIEEVFQDMGDNAKKLVKSKPFKIAAICVAGVALYVAFTRNNEDETQGYGAIGYAGYPSTTGGGEDMSGIGSEGFDSSYFEQILAEMQTNQDQNFSDLYSHLSDIESSMYDDSVSGGALEVGTRNDYDANAEMLAYIERQNAISKMRANSELYNNITDRAMKNALHEENLAIAEAMGWTYDPNTYNYYENGQILYTTAKQEAGLLAPKSANSGSVSFKNNVDYQKEINKAIMSGQSATVIDSLNQKRNAKISAQGGLTSGQAAGYDKNVDYSVLISKAKETGASADVIKNLETQRQNKINAVYGGVDPAKKYGSSGTKTATQTTQVTEKKTTSNSLARDKSSAGTSVTKNGWKTTYDKNGYAVSKVRVN